MRTRISLITSLHTHGKILVWEAAFAVPIGKSECLLMGLRFIGFLFCEPPMSLFVKNKQIAGSVNKHGFPRQSKSLLLPCSPFLTALFKAERGTISSSLAWCLGQYDMSFSRVSPRMAGRPRSWQDTALWAAALITTQHPTLLLLQSMLLLRQASCSQGRGREVVTHSFHTNSSWHPFTKALPSPSFPRDNLNTGHKRAPNP